MRTADRRGYEPAAVEPGTDLMKTFARYVTARAQSFFSLRGVGAIAASRFPGDTNLPLLLRAPVAPFATSDAAPPMIVVGVGGEYEPKFAPYA